MAFAVRAAAGPQRYTRALAALDTHVATLTRTRLQAAHARIDRSQYPALAEFDLIHGLTGLGAYHLRRPNHNSLLREVLAYLVRLTHPIGDLPGWWTPQALTGRRDTGHPGGHANHGTAHGITGPLALLSLAAHSGIIVDGQPQAIERICAWLDSWRQEHHSGPWWPEVLTRNDLRRARPTQTAPGRPSWCYGTPGLARAQQVAGQATDNVQRQRMAEDALAGCLNDPHQRARITDHGLCHGTAGLVQAGWRIASEAPASALANQVRDLAECLPGPEPGEALGFLNGATGTALALGTVAAEQPPATGWDGCLLLN